MRLYITIILYQVDPYLGIGDDLQVFVKPRADGTVYYSLADNEEGVKVLTDLKHKIVKSNNTILDMISKSLSCITEVIGSTFKYSRMSTRPEVYI